jgi:hypothetical protein
MRASTSSLDTALVRAREAIASSEARIREQLTHIRSLKPGSGRKAAEAVLRELNQELLALQNHFELLRVLQIEPSPRRRKQKPRPVI